MLVFSRDSSYVTLDILLSFCFGIAIVQVYFFVQNVFSLPNIQNKEIEKILVRR